MDDTSIVRKWVVDNKLSIHCGEDKTNCILFSKERNFAKLNIAYDNNRIEHIHIVEYPSCYLDANLSKKSMAMKHLKKNNAKLQSLYTQNEFFCCCVSS